MGSETDYFIHIDAANCWLMEMLKVMETSWNSMEFRLLSLLRTPSLVSFPSFIWKDLMSNMMAYNLKACSHCKGTGLVARLL
jgi:hypothetical protein